MGIDRTAFFNLMQLLFEFKILIFFFFQLFL